MCCGEAAPEAVHKARCRCCPPHHPVEQPFVCTRVEGALALRPLARLAAVLTAAGITAVARCRGQEGQLRVGQVTVRGSMHNVPLECLQGADCCYHSPLHTAQGGAQKAPAGPDTSHNTRPQASWPHEHTRCAVRELLLTRVCLDLGLAPTLVPTGLAAGAAGECIELWVRPSCNCCLKLLQHLLIVLCAATTRTTHQRHLTNKPPALLLLLLLAATWLLGWLTACHTASTACKGGPMAIGS
jgi:hypothetical protein